MNTVLLLLILVPIIEIFLFIKIGSQIGAIATILLIFITAIVGVYYAKYEGLNILKSGFTQLRKNETPKYRNNFRSCNCISCISSNNSWICYRYFWFFNFISFTRNFFLRNFLISLKKKKILRKIILLREILKI